MATRSTIAMEQPDGRVMQIYCHWDGHLDHNGQILQEHYRDRAKVLALMMLGDLSSLGNTISEPHDFDNSSGRNDCTAYGRDRGEDGVEARVYKSYNDYRSNAQFEEYNYCYRLDDQWYVEFYGRFDGLLESALKQKEALED